MRTLFLILLVSGLARAQVPAQVEQQFFSNTAAVESGGLANTLLMMSVASMGSAMSSVCLTQSGTALPRSVTTFASASAIYALAETTAATQHRLNLEARLADVRTQADISKVRGGGDTQRKTLVEAIVEQRAMMDYITMKIGWLSAAASQYQNAVAEAANESLDGTNPDYIVNCPGLIAASTPVANSFSDAYKVFGADNKISIYLPQVLSIAVNDLLPFTSAPDQRVILGSLAIEVAGKVVAELQASAVNIQTNIANTEKVLTQFDLEEGVALNSGMTPGEAPTKKETAASTTDAVAGTFTPTVQSGSASVGTTALGSSAANILPALKKAIDVMPAGSASKLANALASRDVAAANIAAGDLANQAANITAKKETAVKTLNMKRLRTARPMLDTVAETKKAMARVYGNISQAVIKAGGSSALLASITPVKSTPTAAPAVADASAQTPHEINPADLPYRLRGKAHALRANPAVSNADEKTVEAKEASEPELTIWKKLSNRYQLNYDRFFERKKLP